MHNHRRCRGLDSQVAPFDGGFAAILQSVLAWRPADAVDLTLTRHKDEGDFGSDLAPGLAALSLRRKSPL